MAQILKIHSEMPQLRLIHQALESLQEGKIIIYPTDSAYALGCKIGDKDAADKIRLIRKLDKNHNFTLICRDLSELASYAIVDNSTYRLLKAVTPGPYTFILHASREVPRRLQHPKRKSIGLRIPDNNITQKLLSELREPLMSVTLILPGSTLPLFDPEVIYSEMHNLVDIIIDGGPCSPEPTTVVDFTEGASKIVRQGKGDVGPFV